MFDPEKGCNELQEDIESEEDPWAGTGMDDDEETLPKEQHAGKEAGGVWGKTKKDDNCQSMTGPKRRILRSGRDEACLLRAVSLGQQHFWLPMKY